MAFVNKFFSKFENSDRSLLGPNLWGLEKWGLWKPNWAWRLFLFTYVALFEVSQFGELWCLRNNYGLALRNLSFTLLSFVCFVKSVTFILWQKRWKVVIEYVTNLEKAQKLVNDQETEKIIRGYTKYSKIITYFYWSLAATTVFAAVLTPFVAVMASKEYFEKIKNGGAWPEIMSSWFPFDKSRGLGYIASVIIQAVIYVWGGGCVASYDSTAVTIMSFIHGQLKILKFNCEQMFGNGSVTMSYEDAVKRIKMCHNHHVELVQHCKMLNSLLSPVLFLYVVICSFMICASAIQITTGNPGKVEQIWIVQYLIALTSQLFLYCWHSNEVYYMSKEVDYGVFMSAWWSQDVRVRRCVLLLDAQLRKTIKFSAGPFTTLETATFINILKGAYSYYTLLEANID